MKRIEKIFAQIELMIAVSVFNWFETDWIIY